MESMPPREQAKSPVKNIVASCQFNDVDQFGEQVKLFGNLQIAQLSTDKFRCDTHLLVLDEAVFLWGQTTCPIWIRGDKQKGFVPFNLVLSSPGSGVISHTRKLNEQILFAFSPNLDTNFIVPPHLTLATWLIREDILQNILQIMDRSDLDTKFWNNNYVRGSATLSDLRAYLHQLWLLIQHQPDFLRHPHPKKLLLDDFLPLLINAIPPVTADLLQPPPAYYRAQVVKQAEDYMMTYIDQPLTLKDLCQVLHISRSPLFHAFKDVLGVSPMEYLKVQRLHRVRRLLQAADPEVDSVKDIARKFGFWSAGHFSRDYKALFGELPSVTLRGGSQTG